VCPPNFPARNAEQGLGSSSALGSLNPLFSTIVDSRGGLIRRFAAPFSPMRHWLLKSEPREFGIADLKRQGVSGWDGVRNYQACNMMRDEKSKDDFAFFFTQTAMRSASRAS
jgi:hypothetical protein